MNSDLEKLIALQAADREMGRVNGEVALLPRRVAAIESQLADTRAKVEKAKAAIVAVQKDREKSWKARSRTTSRRSPSTAISRYR